MQAIILLLCCLLAVATACPFAHLVKAGMKNPHGAMKRAVADNSNNNINANTVEHVDETVREAGLREERRQADESYQRMVRFAAQLSGISDTPHSKRAPGDSDSICDRYTRALKDTVTDNNGLLSFIVTETFGKLIDTGTSGHLKAFFDGTGKGARNVDGQQFAARDFTQSDATTTALVTSLVTFFAPILGCTDETIGDYEGETDLRKVHRFMPITEDDFDFFNDALIKVLADAGVTVEDQAVVRSVLNSTEYDVCSLCDNVPILIDTKKKTAAHPEFNAGFDDGYTVNGVEGAEMQVYAGTTYVIKVANGCLHPFYFTTSPVGVGQSPETRGYVSSAAEQYCGNATLTWKAPESFIGRTDLYYQCRNHGKMGGRLTVLPRVGDNVQDEASEASGFTIRTKFKTADSSTFGIGFPVGFQVEKTSDGTILGQSATLTLFANQRYTFTIANGCAHPFYLTTFLRGTNLLPLGAAAGVGNETTSDPDGKLCNGATVDFTPTEALIGTDIFYQCVVHDAMGGRIRVVKRPLCERLYGSGASQKTKLEAVFERLFPSTFTGPFDTADTVYEFFDGTYFNGNASHIYSGSDSTTIANRARLVDLYVAWFGRALGCSATPAYEGRPLDVAHADLAIEIGPWNEYADLIRDAFDAQKAADSTTDVDTDHSELNAILESAKGGTCNFGSGPGSCRESICDRYSEQETVMTQAGNKTQLVANANEDFVTAVVATTFGKLVANADLKKFFDGTTPAGSTDFTADTTEAQNMTRGRLVADLVNFFGNALGCSQGSFTAKFPPKNPPVDLRAVHFFMPITKTLFDKFNELLVEAIAEEITALNGTAQGADVTAIQALLDSTAGAICNQPGCPGVVTTQPAGVATTSTAAFTGGDNVSIAVTVQLKTNAHPLFQQGNAAGYLVDGVEGGRLKLKLGNRYIFRVNNPCSHPFYIGRSAGFGADAFTEDDGVTGRNACDGGELIYVPIAAHKESTRGNKAPIQYACANHNLMGGQICVYETAESECAAAEETLSQTFCDRYSRALEITNRQLLETVVVATFTNLTDTAKSDNLKSFFDGTGDGRTGAGASTARNFLDASLPHQGALVESLSTFFGEILGCSDGTLGPYLGERDLVRIHQNMPIDEDDFDFFNAQLLAVMTRAGVVEADTNAVSQVLSATKNDVCTLCSGSFASRDATVAAATTRAPAGGTICERYANILQQTQQTLVTNIVVNTFLAGIGGAAEDGPLITHFDGSGDGKGPNGVARNFVGTSSAATTARGGLVESLVAFFGSALGCTSPIFPEYTGETDMAKVHANMVITREQFDIFNDAVIQTSGVDEDDAATIRSLLNGFCSDICTECTPEECDKMSTVTTTAAGGTDGAASLTAAITTVLLAAGMTLAA